MGSRDVTYAEITAETVDGPIVYLAAPRATGYALIVVADRDPQFLQLPRLDQASGSAIANSLFGSSGLAHRGAHDVGTAVAAPAVSGSLRAVWDLRLKSMSGLYARGPIVTLVPVGLFRLLPLQAIGNPGPPGHRETEWQHVGHFSAIRHAPNASALREWELIRSAAVLRQCPLVQEPVTDRSEMPT